jgi:hypothetical protein
MLGPLDFWMWTSGAAVINGEPGPHPLRAALAGIAKSGAFTRLPKTVVLAPHTKTADLET